MSRAIVILLFGVLFSSLLTLPASAETSTANSVSPTSVTIVKSSGGCPDFDFSPATFCGTAQFTVTSNQPHPFGFLGVDDVPGGPLGGIWTEIVSTSTAGPAVVSVVEIGLSCLAPAGPHTIFFVFADNTRISVTVNVTNGPPAHWNYETWYADCTGVTDPLVTITLDASLPPTTTVNAQVMTVTQVKAVVGTVSQVRAEFGSVLSVPYNSTLSITYPDPYGSYRLLSPSAVSAKVVGDTVVSANYSNSGLPLWLFILIAFVAGLAAGLLARGYRRERKLRRHYQALYLSSARTEDAEEKEGERR